MLARELPAGGTVLELASGTGEHAVFFARAFPHLQWQPSDADADALASIAAWSAQVGLANLLPPLAIDARAAEWPVDSVSAVVAINMVHISPWAATDGLFAGAARVMAGSGPLVLYGPYFERDVVAAASNTAFDLDLKRRNPQWGLRLAEDVDALALKHGFARSARYPMPANNLMLIYRQPGGGQHDQIASSPA